MTEVPQGLSLGSEFPTPTHDAWLALVNKALKGADFDRRLVSRTADGLAIQPLYTRGDELDQAVIGNAGHAPFTRGTQDAVQGLGWDIRQVHAEEDPEQANAAILEDLSGGATSITLQIAAPGSFGLPYYGDAIARALADVDLDLCPVHLDAGEYVTDAAGSLMATWRARGLAERAWKGAFNADPLGALARTGGLYHPLDRSLQVSAQLAIDAQALPNVTAMTADGSVYHAAGATEAQELAAVLATFVAYLRAADQAGLAPQAAIPKVAATVAVDADQFLGIAKLRALRRLLWRISEAAGAGDAASRIAVSAITSSRMMAQRDPWVNMLRTTIACAAAALGGAQSITVLPFTCALGRTDSFARRMARNTQIVLQEESGLGRVIDPAGGSWYVERLTDDLARKAWSLFQDIEGRTDGTLTGMGAALRSGWLQDEIGKSRETRAKAVATGRVPLIGVSAFPKLGDDGVTAEPWPHPLPAGDLNGERCAPLPAVRLAEPFEALRDAADAFEARTKSPPAVFLVPLGSALDFRTRAIWIENFLAAGGIKTVAGDGFTNSADAGAAFADSGATVACICSTDEVYAELAEATASVLRSAGAKAVYLAGRPANDAELRAAGVSEFIYAGCDAVAVLGRLQKLLEVQ